MAFVVSARKYRPQKFKEVVGQSSVTTTLKNALKNDKLAQSFLFCGPRGVGKTTCARILAKVINCKNVTEDTEPCGTCSSCKSFNESASFNIFELDAASNNSVDDIRNLIEQVRFAPQAGKYKVYIIDEVHMLSQAAFNAFLKTLEEPPPYAIFILATTEKYKILPTILSRCQIFDFSRIKVGDTVEHLQTICIDKNIEAEPDALHIIAQKADGALRDALSIFDRVASFSEGKIEYQKILHTLNVLDYDYYFQLTDALLSQDHATALILYDEILQKGFDGDIFISGLASHFRDLLVCKDAKTVELLEVTESLRNRYAQQAGITSGSFLLTALNIANQCEINYKAAKNKRLQVELCLMKMCYITAAIDLSKEAKTVTHLSAAPRMQAQIQSSNSNASLNSNLVKTQNSNTLKPATPQLAAPKTQSQGSNSNENLKADVNPNLGKTQNSNTSKPVIPKLEEPQLAAPKTQIQGSNSNVNLKIDVKPNLGEIQNSKASEPAISKLEEPQLAAPKIQMQGSNSNANLKIDVKPNLGEIQNSKTSEPAISKLEEPQAVYQAPPPVQRTESKVLSKSIILTSTENKPKPTKVNLLEKANEHKTKRGSSINGDFNAVRKQTKQKKEEENRKLEAEKKAAEVKANRPIVEISEKTLQSTWKKFAEQLQSNRTKGIFEGVQPKLKGEEIIVVVAKNNLKNTINEEKNNFMSYLSSNVGNNNLRLRIDVDETEIKTKKPYTNEERFQAMAKDNPALVNMFQRLDLQFN